MESIEIKLVGTSPLILKSDRTVDPFDHFVVAMKPLKDKKKKTDEDNHLLRRLEWESGLYMDAAIGPFVPGWNVIRSLRDGAAMLKKGKDVIRGVLTDTKIRIDYDGPRTADAMYADGRFVDVRRVVNNGGGATMRARPRFDEWSMQLTLDFDEHMISRPDLLSAFERAGKFAGIGEYRPSSPKGGQFGRYEVSVC